MSCTLRKWAQPVDPTRVYNTLSQDIYDLCQGLDGVTSGTTPVPGPPGSGLFALAVVNPDATPVHNPDGTWVYVISALP